MSGSVRHLPARDCWQARIFDANLGRERTKVFGHGVTSKKEARALSYAVLAELQQQVDAEAKARGTVAWYAERWLNDKRRELSPTTAERSYAAIVARIAKHFGTMPMDQVTPRHVKEFYGKLADTRSGTGKRRRPLSAKTIERHHQVLRAMFNDAVVDEYATVNPTRVKRPKPRKAQVSVPTEADVARLLDGVSGNFGNMVRLEAETGMRNGELCGLMWSDITPHEHAELVDGRPVKVNGLMISVERAVVEVGSASKRTRDIDWHRKPRGGWWGVKGTKTDQEREILVTEDGMLALVDQLGSVVEQMHGNEVRARAGFVFPDIAADPSGRTPRMPSWITRRWSKVRDEFGLDGVRFYDLRHFHGSHLNASGMDPKVIQERLGHSTILTTLNTYVHVSEQQAIGAAKASRVKRPEKS